MSGPRSEGGEAPVAHARRRVPERLDVRPLDRFRSFKVKLGILVGVSVTVAALLTQVATLAAGRLAVTRRCRSRRAAGPDDAT